MPEDLMRYDILAQQALRGVVRAALKRVERSGLPGEHHFYIAFDTTHPQTKVSDRLKRKYPEEMTIVIQHQFWGLDVTADGFSVELSFDNVPEKMEIPFAAVKGFFDPYIQFGLQFEMDEANQNVADGDNTVSTIGEEQGDASVSSELAGTSVDNDEKPKKQSKKKAKSKTAKKEDPASENTDGDEETVDEASQTASEDNDNGKDKIVSLDAFRKK